MVKVYIIFLNIHTKILFDLLSVYYYFLLITEVDTDDLCYIYFYVFEVRCWDEISPLLSWEPSYHDI